MCRALGLRWFFRPVIEVEDEDSNRVRTFVGKRLKFKEGEELQEEPLKDMIEDMWPSTRIDWCRVTWLGEKRWEEPGLSYIAVSCWSNRDAGL